MTGLGPNRSASELEHHLGLIGGLAQRKSLNGSSPAFSSVTWPLELFDEIGEALRLEAANRA